MYPVLMFFVIILSAASCLAEDLPVCNKVVNSLGMEFTPVQGLDGVLFSVWETRNQDYRAYKADHDSGDFDGQSLNENEQPVVMVTWDDAGAFCKWLTERERGKGLIGARQCYRLPADWEWSVAVGLNESRGGIPREKDGKIKDVYPWDKGKGQWPPRRNSGNYHGNESVGAWSRIDLYEDDHPVTAPVGSFEAGANGLFDLGGNGWEWCADDYDKTAKTKTLRGASWNNAETRRMLSSSRFYIRPAARSQNFGFRVVLSSENRSCAH